MSNRDISPIEGIAYRVVAPIASGLRTPTQNGEGGARTDRRHTLTRAGRSSAS
jgi:hypothetical protein